MRGGGVGAFMAGLRREKLQRAATAEESTRIFGPETDADAVRGRTYETCTRSQPSLRNFGRELGLSNAPVEACEREGGRSISS